MTVVNEGRPARNDSDPALPTPGSASGGGCSRLRLLKGGIFVALLIVGAIVGVSCWRFGAPFTAFRILTGQRFLLQEPAYRLQEPPKDEGTPLTLKACNLTSSTLILYGLLTYCGLDGCVITAETFPLEIAPMSYRNISFAVQPPKDGRPFSRLTTELYTSRGSFEIVVERESAENPR
jgi:hypothetical protein